MKGSGSGEGEWLVLRSSCDAPILGLQVINGLAESRVIFPQFDRVAQARLTLSIDEQEVWSEPVRFLDQMKKQYLPLPSYACSAGSSYALRVEVMSVYPSSGRTCLSEIVPVSLLEREGPDIVRGTSNCRVKTYALAPLRFFAGPGESYAFLGVAPVYPSQYGSPVVHVVEHRNGWLRVDSVQRSFSENERPAESVDPRWGGWVHSKQLSFAPLDAGLFKRPETEAPVQKVSSPKNFSFVSCKEGWVEVQNETLRGWGRNFCPEDRGCF